MWLFTRFGFYSIAAKGEQVEVRARCKKHLENLLKRYSIIKPLPYKIIALKNRDYPFRLRIPRRVWSNMVTILVLEQTWSNFKGECVKSMKDDKAYLDLLHDTWWRAKQAYEKKNYGYKDKRSGYFAS